MCATARTHLLGEKRATARPLLLGEKRATARPLLLQWSGMCEGATAGTVAPSHLLLKFGKLTIEFETLFQFRKAESRRPSVAAYGKAVPSRLSHLRSVS